MEPPGLLTSGTAPFNVILFGPIKRRPENMQLSKELTLLVNTTVSNVQREHERSHAVFGWMTLEEISATPNGCFQT